jgi:ferric-dicitrate binding protein FerR (iron transport regulator)
MRENQQYQRYLQLAQKWVDGTISEAELKEYTDWLKRIDADAHIEIPAEIATSKAAHREKIFRALQHRIKGEGLQRHKPVYRSMLRWAAMFTGVILVGYMAYYLRDSTKEQPAQKAVTAIQDDVQPGTHGAILALGNGKVIVLDTAANGTLDNNVMKSREAVVFDRAPEGGPVQYNTLTTPRARQQQLVLPDGSRIWLNAESSIRFPAAFTGETREVEISGEVYFEINPDKTKPFIVKVQQSSVVVLGTHFNVMAYSDEAFLETTLLEGAVSFRSNNEQMILKPGQQSRLSQNKQLQLVPNPDIEVIMAWKNGFQSFKKADIGMILRQIKRWYDVEVEYEGTIPSELTFTGEIPREVTLSQLLKALESKQLHFALDAPNKKLQVRFNP